MLEVTQQPRQYLFTWPGWRLEFCWHSDRWQHILWRAQPAGWQRLVQSVEGTSDQPWPDSPAFQNAYVERINPHCCEVQLLGQAGKNHYSGAVRCDSESQIIDFDIAVRIHTEPATPLLMSSYQVSGAPAPTDASKSWELTTETLPNQPPIVADWTAVPAASHSIARLRMPDLAAMHMEKQRATLRWKYQWRIGHIA